MLQRRVKQVARAEAITVGDGILAAPEMKDAGLLQRRGHVAARGLPAAGGKKGIPADGQRLMDSGEDFPHLVGVGGVPPEGPFHVQQGQNRLLPGIRPGLEQFFRVVPLRRPALKAAHIAPGKVETPPRIGDIAGNGVRRFPYQRFRRRVRFAHGHNHGVVKGLVFTQQPQDAALAEFARADGVQLARQRIRPGRKDGPPLRRYGLTRAREAFRPAHKQRFQSVQKAEALGLGAADVLQCLVATHGGQHGPPPLQCRQPLHLRRAGLPCLRQRLRREAAFRPQALLFLHDGIHDVRRLFFRRACGNDRAYAIRSCGHVSSSLSASVRDAAVPRRRPRRAPQGHPYPVAGPRPVRPEPPLPPAGPRPASCAAGRAVPRRSKRRGKARPYLPHAG